MRDLCTIEDAVALLDDWIEAHRDLLRQFRRLEVKNFNTEQERDYWKSLSGFYEQAMIRGIGDKFGRQLKAASESECPF